MWQYNPVLISSLLEEIRKKHDLYVFNSFFKLLVIQMFLVTPGGYTEHFFWVAEVQRSVITTTVIKCSSKAAGLMLWLHRGKFVDVK